MTTNTLIEHVSDWHAGLTVDRTNRIVRNVALTGLTSKNGYRYTEHALQMAAALYDQKPVFLDHAADKSRPHERSTRDLVGAIINPHYEAGRIRGDIRVLDTESGRTFLALAESDAPGVGMSHVVLAQRASTDGAVERIHDVVSVDAVAFPATTKTFRESVNTTDAPTADPGNDHVAVIADATAEVKPDGGDMSPLDKPSSAADHAAVASETSDPDLQNQLQLLLRERNELLDELRSARERKSIEVRDRQLEEAIRESDLPTYALTESFRQQLMTAKADDRITLIRERQQLIEAARTNSPRSPERSSTAHPANLDTSFVSTIRRRAS